MSRILVAAAGSGKTTYLVRQALQSCGERILITTYTDANTKSIIEKFYELYGCIPSNVTIMPWFTFLLCHGVRPYQGYFTQKSLKGIYLVNQAPQLQRFCKNDDIKKYITTAGSVYSNTIAKFVCILNEKSKGSVIGRITNIYQKVFIDEVQDLAGYDLEIIKKLEKAGCNLLIAGDTRQATYRTHTEQKYKKYCNGKITEFIKDEVPDIEIDTTTLKDSHRNNQKICDLANRLYPNMEECNSAMKMETGHDGIFWVHTSDIEKYIQFTEAVQLKYSNCTKVLENAKSITFGNAKGLTFERVLIYPTKPMLDWFAGKAKDLKPESRSKFYVTITRAKYSVGIVYNTKKVPNDEYGIAWHPDN